MAKKAMNFKSKAKEQAWIKAVHSIPSKNNPSISVAQAAAGNTPLKVKGKAVTVKHTTVKKVAKKKVKK
jgi:hypothetical protein